MRTTGVPIPPRTTGLGDASGGSGGGVQYLLLDRFVTTEAAPIASPRTCEPGPGTLTRVDTNSKLSITGGVLSCATGGAGANDPRIYGSASWARLAGRVVLGSVVWTANGLEIGWDTANTGTAYDGFYFTTTIGVRRAGAALGMGTLAAATTYRIAIPMRASGAFMFVKGGVFTEWTLVWVDDVGSSALWAVIYTNTATAVWTVDDFRIPDVPWLPVPLLSDSFNRADGAIGSTDGAGHAEANGGNGLAWSGATWAIASNTAKNTPALGSDLVVNGAFAADTDWGKGAGWTIAAGVATATAASSDLTASVAPLTLGTWYKVTYDVSGFVGGTVRAKLGTNTLPTHGANGAVAETGRAIGSGALAFTAAAATLNIDNATAKALALSELFCTVAATNSDVLLDVAPAAQVVGYQLGGVGCLDSAATPANFLLAYFDGAGNVKLDKCVAGVYSNLVSASITFAAGAILRLIKWGTEVRVYYNNAQVGTTQTVSDAGIVNNTRHGLFSTDPTPTANLVVGWARGSGGEYIALDGM